MTHRVESIIEDVLDELERLPNLRRVKKVGAWEYRDGLIQCRRQVIEWLDRNIAVAIEETRKLGAVSYDE